MRSVSVVTKSGIVHDEKQTIELIDKADVKAIVQQSLGSIRQELEEQEGKISDLRSQISALQRNTSEHKEEIAALKKNIIATSKQITDSTGDLNQKFDAHREAVFAALEALKKSLCSDFINKCSEDVQRYFRQLIEYAEKISNDAAAMQKMQKTIEEQYMATSAVAQYFCDYYKSELKRREEEILQESERLSILNSALPQTQHVDKE